MFLLVWEECTFLRALLKSKRRSLMSKDTSNSPRKTRVAAPIVNIIIIIIIAGELQEWSLCNLLCRRNNCCCIIFVQNSEEEKKCYRSKIIAVAVLFSRRAFRMRIFTASISEKNARIADLILYHNKASSTRLRP